MTAQFYGRPSLDEENRLRARGYRLIAGVDEAGRGALMGPVVAAAVIMREDTNAGWEDLVRDSKELRPEAREMLYEHIMRTSVAVGVGFSSAEVIDSLGIVPATRLAMVSAVAELDPRPDYVLIDYLSLPELPCPNHGITDGDARCFSIACASIVAKVTRDRMVMELDRKYPGYGFAAHKGYGTKEHLECLMRLGPCPVHRRSFRPVAEVLQRQ